MHKRNRMACGSVSAMRARCMYARRVSNMCDDAKCFSTSTQTTGEVSDNTETSKSNSTSKSISHPTKHHTISSPSCLSWLSTLLLPFLSCPSAFSFFSSFFTPSSPHPLHTLPPHLLACTYLFSPTWLPQSSPQQQQLQPPTPTPSTLAHSSRSSSSFSTSLPSSSSSTLNAPSWTNSSGVSSFSSAPSSESSSTTCSHTRRTVVCVMSAFLEWLYIDLTLHHSIACSAHLYKFRNKSTKKTNNNQQ